MAPIFPDRPVVFFTLSLCTFFFSLLLGAVRSCLFYLPQ